MVDVDQLHLVGEGRQPGFVVAVVAAGPAVDDEGDRLLDHAGTIGYEPRALDVEPDFCAANARFHSRVLSLNSSNVLLKLGRPCLISGLRVGTRNATEVLPASTTVHALVSYRTQ